MATTPSVRRGFFKLTIRRKLYLSVALLALTLIGNTIVLVHSYWKTANAIDDVRLVEQAIGSIFESSLFVRDYLATSDDRAAQQWRAAYRRLGVSLDQFASFPSDAEGEVLIARRVSENYVILGTLFDRLTASHQSRGWGSDEAEKLIEQSLLMRTNILIADAYKLSAINNAEIARERQTFVVMMAVSVVVSVLVCLFIILVNRRIVTSLSILRHSSKRIGAHDFLTPIALTGHDEFTELAATMNLMSSQVERYYGELRDSEERYLLLFNRSPQPMWVYDALHLTFLAVNDCAIEHYGFSRDEFAAMTLKDIRPAEDIPAFLQAVSLPKSNENIGEWRHCKKDGTIIDVVIRGTPILYGNHPARIVLIQDVTERKKSEKMIADANRRLEAQTLKLQHANKELEQFAYVASHDLREPLRMVASFLSLIERELGRGISEDCREYISIAKDGATRMDRLIRDLLEYSRIGRTEAAKEPVDLNELARQAISDLALAIEDAQGRVELGALPQIYGDSSELERLFQNLISNAIKYRPADRAPVVTISAARDGGDWVVTVADNGIGIAPEFFDRIFGVFQRLHGRGEYEGTGIGLANCKKIVEHHGGRIWVESQPDHGSTFLFALPAAPIVRDPADHDYAEPMAAL